MYKVYEVDVCFTSYAMDICLIGAKNVKDLKAHLREIFEGELENINIEVLLASSGKKELYSRIREMKSLFTDKPYTIIDRFGYYE